MSDVSERGRARGLASASGDGNVTADAMQGAIREGLEEIDPSGIVVSDPDRLGGMPCFRGTRVPTGVVDENLADGMSVDEILDSYPTLDRADVERYVRLRYPRVAVRVEDLSAQEIEMIARSEISVEDGIPRDETRHD